MEDKPFKGNSRWEKLTQEDFTKLVKTRGYSVREDGTIFLPGAHHIFGIIGGFDKEHFVIRLFGNDRYFFKKDPDVTIEDIAEEFIEFIKEKIGEENKIESEFYLE
jgi:hypothetical protein